MSQETVMRFGQAALWTASQIAAPIIISGLVVGLLVSIFQAATQIQEQSLVFVPKVLALLAVLTVGGGWMLTRMVEFCRWVILQLPGLAH
jgi:flagellar biosynthetic protein FliQ